MSSLTHSNFTVSTETTETCYDTFLSKPSSQKKNLFNQQMSIEDKVSKVLAIKGLESFTSAFVGPKIGVESLEDLEEVDDDMMKEIGMTPIQRKKFKKIIESGKHKDVQSDAPKTSVPMPPPSKPTPEPPESQQIKLFSSPDMDKESEIVPQDSSNLSEESPSTSEPPTVPVIVKEEKEAEDESDECIDSDDSLELDFDGEEGDGTKIPPPPKREGEVRTSWMAAMDIFSRSDGAKKTVTTYTIRLVDGSSYNHIVTVDFDGTTSERDESEEKSKAFEEDLLRKLKELHQKRRGSDTCLTKLKSHSTKDLGNMFREIGLEETAKRIEEEEVVGDDLVDFEDEDLEAFEIPKSLHDVLKEAAGGGTDRFGDVQSVDVEEEKVEEKKKKKDIRAEEKKKKKNSTKKVPEKEEKRPRAKTVEETIVQTVTRRIGGSTGKQVDSSKGFSVNDEVEVTYGKRKGQKVTLLKKLNAKVSEPTVCRWLVRLESGKKVRYPETKLDQVGSGGTWCSSARIISIYYGVA